MNLLLDNTVLSNFAIVQRPDLLRVAFGDVLATTEDVFQELQAGMAYARLPAVDWSWLPIWMLQQAEQGHYRQFLRSLNAGEASCLAMALVRGCRVLTDDRDARELAALLQVPISGTIGVLTRLVDMGTLDIPEADSLLGQMINAGYRSPITSLAQILG